MYVLKTSQYDVDDVVKDLSDVVSNVAEAMLPVKSGLPVLKNPNNSRKRKNRWFDKSCFELKREAVLRFGKLTSYKKLVKSKKRSFK